VLRRGRFSDVISRQLDLVEQENAKLIVACKSALQAYDTAGREEAGEHYERFGDLQEELMDALEKVRDGFATTLLDESAAERYEAEFDRAAANRFHGIWVA